MAGVPNISGWDVFFMVVVVGVIGWGSIELVILILKWIIHNLA